ncbi:hypothetical protein K488DRAFT_79159 [Vararia minispora EC-137]|uniref:Uncharacterized protein n=1 Tax=Vararia minispora EC-137 TaxID=1314806 RepID=A0ACB8QHW0_9AGAM|nr:hypothetical protein K488DRAFT_79159 [Vararia minispora EC-137]
MMRLCLALSALALSPLIVTSSADQVIIVLPTLFDLLTLERSGSIFFSYARETELSRLLTDDDSPSTLLIPTNRAIMALARKPHQDPIPVDGGIDLNEQELDQRSKRNVRHWVSLHIIPQSPIDIGLHSFPTLVEGRNVTFEEVEGDLSQPDWTRVLLNGEIRLLGKKEARNGVFFLLDGTMKDGN